MVIEGKPNLVLIYDALVERAVKVKRLMYENPSLLSFGERYESLLGLARKIEAELGADWACLYSRLPQQETEE